MSGTNISGRVFMTGEHAYANIVSKEGNLSYCVKYIKSIVYLSYFTSIVKHLRYGGKYDTSLVANLPLSPTVKEILKSTNSSQSYERISSGTIFVDHGLDRGYN